MEYPPEQRKYWSPPKLKTRLLIYFIFFSFIISFIFLRGYRLHTYCLKDSAEDWDVLIFTQHWPQTVCMTWEEKLKNNSCRMPKEDIWTIHGIWPTKLGTIGPLFCNSSYHFNATQLAPIETNLTENWIDVEVPRPADSFWRHEWRKHGTCAMILPSMNTELGYFKQGLSWLQQYNMKSVLQQGGVQPNNNASTDVTSIWLAVKIALGVNPSIHCVLDKKTGQYYLMELRICFDKSLKLTDCDGVRFRQPLRWQPSGNCPTNKPIYYPSSVPPPSRKPVLPRPDSPIVSVLKLIQFVMWFSS